MNWLRVAIGFFIVIVAVSSGWFIEREPPIAETAPLEIPDNIDYYLTGVNFLSMNSQGKPHYRLRSDYLEHYIREDISHINQPDIDYNSGGSKWLIKSHKGLLQHQQEILELHREASINRVDGAEPMLIESDQIILKPQQDFIEMPKPMLLTSPQLRLEANTATLDIKRNHFLFNQVVATYQPQTHTDTTQN